jgi:light-regulated signal transduction histidine kinase (bacteriophytochrome)
VNLSDVATDCALLFEPVAFEAGKTLESTNLPENITVTGDAEKLRQLLSVLLDNAIKYGRDGGETRPGDAPEARRSTPGSPSTNGNADGAHPAGAA